MIDPWFLRELRALAEDPEGPFAGERSFRAVDTCAAEFPARTPYYYSGWERERSDEVRRGERRSVVILGSGPNRIGQGIEFDYCCVHAAMTVRESGRDAVMVNCNPETVSTDYDTSDRLYFEPLTLEDVLAVVAIEQPRGVIVQFGGQTPLKLAAGLVEAGVPLLGTSVEAIDLAEDRGRFGALLERLGLQAPPYATARSVAEALQEVEQVGFPLLVRPSYVLGGRAMEIVYSREGLEDYLRREGAAEGTEIFLDRFLENAIEVDVDALCDGSPASGGGGQVWIGGIMQHVEEAGVHSGDSACVLPPHSLGEEMLEQIRAATRAIALEMGVVGLLNVQYAVHAGELYVIEANPRASRTVPFVSKAVGVPLAKLACRIMLGERIADMGLPPGREGMGYGEHVSVKEAVLPFDRFEGSDAVLGPEMRSTGEVMGIARDFPTAFAKAQAAAGVPLPTEGTAFITVTDSDKAGAFAVAQILHDNGFRIVATRGTAEAIARMGVPVERLNKIGEGSPHVLDWIERGDVDLVVNTPTGFGARTDGWEIRRAAVTHGIPCLTTLSAGVSAARAIASARRDGEPRGAVPAGAARGRGGVSDSSSPLAPFGRRLLTVTGMQELGDVYRVLRVADPDGPEPRPGQFAMLAAAERWGGGEDERPYLPRAFSIARRRPGESQFLLEDVGPGTRRLCELERGRRAVVARASGGWLQGSQPTGGGRSSWAAAWGSRRSRSCRTSSRPGLTVLLGFRDGARCAGRDLLRDAAVASDDGSAGHHGPVTDLLLSELERDQHAVVYACGPAAMLEAVRAICAERAVPAQLALEAGMACGFGACFGCAVPRRGGGYLRVCVDGPVIDAAELERIDEHAGAPAVSVEFCGLELAHPVINGSGTFDAIAARRAFGDGLCEAFPFAAYVSKTITLEPRPGNPPPRLWESAGGLINSIGLPNKGLERYMAEDLPELASLTAAVAESIGDGRSVPLITNVMGSSAAEFAQLVEACEARAEIAAVELNVSCPNVRTGLDIGADPRAARGCRARRSAAGPPSP